jgi:hypothetical protein
LLALGPWPRWLWLRCELVVVQNRRSRILRLARAVRSPSHCVLGLLICGSQPRWRGFFTLFALAPCARRFLRLPVLLRFASFISCCCVFCYNYSDFIFILKLCSMILFNLYILWLRF